jgi:hypothetical protein
MPTLIKIKEGSNLKSIKPIEEGSLMNRKFT